VKTTNFFYINEVGAISISVLPVTLIKGNIFWVPENRMLSKMFVTKTVKRQGQLNEKQEAFFNHLRAMD
jgi:hypothetical protein